MAPLWAAHALWILWAVSWLVAAMWHGRTAAAARPATVRRWLALAAAGFVLLFVENPFRLHPLWFRRDAVGWAMVALVAAGLALAWWARLHLGRLWSGGIVVREGHRVVDSGPYRLVRHPIYTGLVFGAAGLAVIRGTPLSLVGVLVILAGFYGKASAEERFLRRSLGDSYLAYRRRVPMLIPFTR